MIKPILASSDNGSAAGAFFIFVLWALGFLFYWIPTIVAVIRKMPNTGSIVVINLFLGWTCIGWIVSLAMAGGR
jgi:hypothetical protein